MVTLTSFLFQNTKHKFCFSEFFQERVEYQRSAKYIKLIIHASLTQMFFPSFFCYSRELASMDNIVVSPCDSNLFQHYSIPPGKFYKNTHVIDTHHTNRCLRDDSSTEFSHFSFLILILLVFSVNCKCDHRCFINCSTCQNNEKHQNRMGSFNDRYTDYREVAFSARSKQ